MTKVTTVTGMVFLTLAVAAALLVHRSHREMPQDSDDMFRNTRLHSGFVREASTAMFRPQAGSLDSDPGENGAVRSTTALSEDWHDGTQPSAVRRQMRQSSAGIGFSTKSANPNSESTLAFEDNRGPGLATGTEAVENLPPGTPVSHPAYPVASIAATADLEDFTPAERSVVLSLAHSFAESITPPAETSSAGEESQAAFRDLSVEAHDDHLRLTLGWEAFNRLSAVSAAQLSRSPINDHRRQP